LKRALYPLLFHPIPKERIWGGRKLETLYHKPIPGEKPIGESWEISDRTEAESVISNGPLAGKTLRHLMEHHAAELMGDAKPLNGKFPLLVKILDAREKLSLQVHPPAAKAKDLGGEPKTEMWYITDAAEDAELYVGLRRSVTPESFKESISAGTVEHCFHKAKVKAGDAMFLPSGRVHAIAGGLVIFEIQQNSDTTYRVFDWNRVDSQGKSRELHVKESLECIDFEDFEPEIIKPDQPLAQNFDVHLQTLVDDPLFKVELVSTGGAAHIDYSLRRPKIIGVVEGSVNIRHEFPLQLRPGQFALLPAELQRARIECGQASRFLVAEPG
jgi:mannose-6-phosphate isomerase